jgi:hypothetical protein
VAVNKSHIRKSSSS